MQSIVHRCSHFHELRALEVTVASEPMTLLFLALVTSFGLGEAERNGHAFQDFHFLDAFLFLLLLETELPSLSHSHGRVASPAFG